MALELPSYKVPSLRTALLTTKDRGMVFLKKAGTSILAISIILWWLSAFPKVAPPPEAQSLRAESAQVAQADPAAAADLASQADELDASYAAQHSFIGRIGSTLQPVFAPLGFDRQLTIGVLASFAAREVFVTTMTVIVLGEEDADIQDQSVVQRLATATRDDGVTPIFTPAVSWALLVYYVLAMQCLPTLAVTARESGSWKWAALQLVWMCSLAYAAGSLIYHVLS